MSSNTRVWVPLCSFKQVEDLIGGEKHFGSMIFIYWDLLLNKCLISQDESRMF